MCLAESNLCTSDCLQVHLLGLRISKVTLLYVAVYAVNSDKGNQAGKNKIYIKNIK
jgi:hypothetical protein